MNCSCGGVLEEIGVLGRRRWFRCRGCGMQYSRMTKARRVRQPWEKRSRKNPGRSPGWAFSKGIHSGHEAGLDVLKAGVDTDDQYYKGVLKLLQEQRKDPGHLIYEFGDYNNSETLLKNFERGENEGARVALNEWKEYLSGQITVPQKRAFVRKSAPVVRRAVESPPHQMSQAEVRAVLERIEAEARRHLEEKAQRRTGRSM